MEHITERYDEDIYESGLFDFYFKGMRVGALDIETTGLDPAGSKFILGGLFDFDSRTMHQVFAESRDEEGYALNEFVREVSTLDMVVTYNGRHFDIPFMNKRLQRFSMDAVNVFNLDLYLILNGYSPVKKFVPNLKQKTVENYMGLWQTRSDEISGAESVELYNSYEKTGRHDLKEKILLHNSDDVLQLTRLLKIISKSEFHKAMFFLGFPAGPLTVKKIKLNRDFMLINGSQRTINTDYISFSIGSYPAEINMNSNTCEFSMKLPLIRDSGLALVDLDAAGLTRSEFEAYPSCASGFLVLEEHGRINYMEINHFIKSFTELLINRLR